jgi:predicted metal-dependent phosphoesterase TrpH
MIDLHVHSDRSDGTDTPERLVELAAKRGLAGFALTDHDTTSGIAGARRRARDLGLELIPAIELSARHEGRSVHLLGYFIDETSSHLEQHLETLRSNRIDRALAIVNRLARDFDISWDEVEEQAGSAESVGRPHLADVLVRKGIGPDRPSVFQALLRDGSPYVVELVAPSLETAVSAIAEAGGVSVLAHPWGRLRAAGLLSKQDFTYMRDLGVAGLEVWHREHPRESIFQLLSLCQHLGMIPTGGSDYHGHGKPNVLGENLTPTDSMRAIVSVARERAEHA